MEKHQDAYAYLRSTEYYIDLYDLFTINECLDLIRFYQKTYKEKSTSEVLKNVPLDEVQKGFSMMLNWNLYAIKGRRYKDKKERLQAWIDKDTKEQEKNDNATKLKNIKCPKFSSLMTSTSKTLIIYKDKQLLGVLFLSVLIYPFLKS